MNVGTAYVQTVGVCEVFSDSILGNLVSGLAELVRLLDYLVVDIGEVLNIETLYPRNSRYLRSVSNTHRARAFPMWIRL